MQPTCIIARKLPNWEGKAVIVVLFGTVPINYRLRVFGCAASVHKHKENWCDKL